MGPGEHKLFVDILRCFSDAPEPDAGSCDLFFIYLNRSFPRAKKRIHHFSLLFVISGHNSLSAINLWTLAGIPYLEFCCDSTDVHLTLCRWFRRRIWRQLHRQVDEKGEKLQYCKIFSDFFL